MAGAHLDSVTAGPGINDNGSGSAATSRDRADDGQAQAARTPCASPGGVPRSRASSGSTAYVAELSQAERERIALYLNYDMVGSPNYVFFVYDGDNSDGVGAPAGSDWLGGDRGPVRGLLHALADSRTRAPTSRGARDYGPFIAPGVDIPSGGLFTGAEGVKTAEEAALWGGTAGQQYDPCYHLACDTFGNVEPHRAERQQRPHRVRAAHVRVLDRVGERRSRQSRFPATAVRLRDGTFDREGRAFARPVLALRMVGDFPYVPRSSTVTPDYELDDVLMVEDPEQLRALGRDIPRANRRPPPRACREHDGARRCARITEGNGRRTT